MMNDSIKKEIELLIDYYNKQVALGLDIDDTYNDVYVYSLDIEKKEVKLLNILDGLDDLDIYNFKIPDVFEVVETDVLGNSISGKMRSLDFNNVKSCKAVLSCLVEVVKSDYIEELSSSFIFNSMLKEFNFKSLKRINDYCFYICHELESIDLKSVKYIGNNCFNHCYKLREIHLENIESIGDGCFNELHNDFKFIFHNKTE